MKAFKITDTANKKDLGRIFVQDMDILNYWWMAGTPTLNQRFPFAHPQNNSFYKVEEIDLLKEKWVHPHLPKKVKDYVYNLLKS